QIGDARRVGPTSTTEVLNDVAARETPPKYEYEAKQRVNKGFRDVHQRLRSRQWQGWKHAAAPRVLRWVAPCAHMIRAAISAAEHAEKFKRGGSKRLKRTRERRRD